MDAQIIVKNPNFGEIRGVVIQNVNDKDVQDLRNLLDKVSSGETNNLHVLIDDTEEIKTEMYISEGVAAESILLLKLYKDVA